MLASLDTVRYHPGRSVSREWLQRNVWLNFLSRGLRRRPSALVNAVVERTPLLRL